MADVFKRADFIVSSVIENLSDIGLADGEVEKNDTAACGTMRICGDEIILVYTERAEGAEVRTRISKSGDTVTVTRQGAIDTVMVFSEGRHYSTVYSLPPYRFDMAIYTRKIRCDISECGGSITLIYDMELGGARKNCRMKITARAEESAQ